MNGRVSRTNVDLEPALAVSRFLAQFPTPSRAEAVHLSLKALRARIEPDRVLMCELAWEVHTHGYWRLVRRDDNSAYESEESYFREVLGLASWRTAYKRLAIGRMLSAFPEPERGAIRAALAQIGVAKATVIAPAIEHTGAWQVWADLARQLAYPVLQARVSAILEALPRGREPSPPGEHFRRAILSAMPDIEAMELVERFFEIGARVVESDHPIAIFLAGCRECLAEWEVQAAGWRSRGLSDRADGPEKRPATSQVEDTSRATRQTPRRWRFAHVGKTRERSLAPTKHAESACPHWPSRPPARSGWRAPGDRAASRDGGRVEPDSGGRPASSRLALPGLWAPQPPRRSPRRQALSGRLGL